MQTDSTTTKYSAKTYEIPANFYENASRLRSQVTYFHIFLIWLAILALSIFGHFLLNQHLFWYFYPLLALIAASRQGALLQIVHEGSHRLISKSKKTNEFVGSWLAALPVGLTLEGYTKGHMKHHAGTNTADDLATDLEKYSVVKLKDPHLYRLFLYDLLGVTALRSFLGHNYKSLKDENAEPNKVPRLALAQIVVITLIFQLDWRLYIFLWALPLISVNMVLLRVRGITEHGVPNQLGLTVQAPDQGNYYTRSVVVDERLSFSGVIHFVERVLIGSLSAHYHHEHHLLPKVPFYNLHKVNKLVGKQIRDKGTHVYVKSYFGALFRF